MLTPQTQAQMISAYLLGDVKTLYHLLAIQQKSDIAFVKQFWIDECGLTQDKYWELFSQRTPKLNE
jgi:hypothetical protein